MFLSLFSLKCFHAFLTGVLCRLSLVSKSQYFCTLGTQIKSLEHKHCYTVIDDLATKMISKWWPVLYLFSSAVMNIMTKLTWRGRGLFHTVVHHEKKWGYEFNAGIWRQNFNHMYAIEECYLLNCSPYLAQSVFSIVLLK